MDTVVTFSFVACIIKFETSTSYLLPYSKNKSESSREKDQAVIASKAQYSQIPLKRKLEFSKGY